jgi:hypothetical protein
VDPITACKTLVVLEYGSSWPPFVDRTNGADVAVVAQHYTGQPGRLLSQVAERALERAAAGWHPQEIVLVSNGSTDVDSEAARSILARGLLASLRNTGGRRLTLSIDDRCGPRARANLRALGIALRPALAGCKLELCVHTGGEPIRYGTGARHAPALARAS